MNWIQSFTNNYLDRETDPRHLLWFQRLFCGALCIQFIKDSPYILWAMKNRVAFNPIQPFELLGITRPSYEVYEWGLYLLIVTLGICAFNFKSRIFLPMALILCFWVVGSQLSLEKSADSPYVYHSKNIIVFVLLILCLAPRNTPRIWPLTLVRLTVGAVYFGAAYCKIVENGFKWMDGNTLQAILYSHGMMMDFPHTLWLANQFWICLLLSVAIMSFELFFIFFALHPFWSIVFVIGALMFHGANMYYLNIDFFAYHSLSYLVFFVGGFGSPFRFLARQKAVVASLLVLAALSVPSENAQASESQLKMQSCHIRSYPKKTFEDEQFGEICRPTLLHANDTAFIFVDFWNFNGEEKDSRILKTFGLLKKLRAHNFHVIHAPGDSAFQFKKYQDLRKEVQNFLGEDYCKKNRDFGSIQRKMIYGHLAKEKSCQNSPRPEYKEEMSKLIRPDSHRSRESVVRYEDEFRYLLWRSSIKNLVYIGGAIDQCLLHRPYGINPLVGTDDNRSLFKVFILEDLVTAMPNSVKDIDYNLKIKTLLASLSYKTVTLSNSDSFVFTPLSKASPNSPENSGK